MIEETKEIIKEPKNKLVCVSSEVKEGVNTLPVCFVGEPTCQPSPYPMTISMDTDLQSEEFEYYVVAGVPKYEVDVNVTFDEKSNPSFEQVSELKERDLSKDEDYLSRVDKLREEEYEKRVDKLTLELVRKQLNDESIIKIVEEIKKELPK